MPPSYSLVAEQHGGDSGGQFKQFENQYGARPPVPQSPRESVSDNQSDRYAQIQDYNPQPESRFYQEQMNGGWSSNRFGSVDFWRSAFRFARARRM